MPVPVSYYPKQPAHPVIKINQSAVAESRSSGFQHLTHSLPLPPSGPPPSFATREEWISSLPSWRRNKPRRIWEEDLAHAQDSCQGFEEGLTVADNAAVIKGAPAQARIPPVSTLLASAGAASRATDMYARSPEEMNMYLARIHGWPCDGAARSTNVSPAASAEYDDRMMEDYQDARYRDYEMNTPGSYGDVGSAGMYASEEYERGAFSPVFEDMSPDGAPMVDPASSPMGPNTPFADYVDSAFAADPFVPSYGCSQPVSTTREVRYAYQDQHCGAQCQQCQTFAQAEQPMAPPAPEPVVTPTATAAYKKMAEPLSDWIASYVWKVCTTGLSLPPDYAQPTAFIKHYSNSPPSHLASSTHSMLLSTLLQPSAIFLALWYIVRLPVFFGPVNLDSERHRKEIRFRDELLGEAHLSFDRDAIESYAPFRLILLGCMLANKWLDDHTFSNKTWHTISNVPVQSLNKLESLALDIFRYDLSISTHEWTDWLSHIHEYHTSLHSPACPQPISRPSSSPHTITRKAIERLIQVGVGRGCCQDATCTMPPEPVFAGLEDEKRDQADAPVYDEDVLEIDLDEDGPLREEYLPRRRVSSVSSSRRAQATEKVVEPERILPPPARWSPAADEPIMRDVRISRQYVAPQPMGHVPAIVPPPPPFHQVLQPQQPTWPYGGYGHKQEQMTSATYAPPPVYARPSHVGFDYAYPATHGHSRSQSLSYNQAVGDHAQGRHRAYSQTRYDQGYSDVRFSENHFALPLPALTRWSPGAVYPPFYDRPSEYQRPLKV
ncbi:uncharacterized protein C8Q71DRAFT_697335 [Rhodofomes roseus]|uniref:Cyclin N-terminal domain-containing protein n=1 Tax=Rhodofomes roseus TaxID=34475 RepID=A0ABQ8KY37_9APHY|nr:uncharacterized protein C8Q71DRAFT_697335 [Rhodofomes roseus]KAH9844212.1 hypothetical protein C8Q71DRAFT_697335 [Rhodofomes roseus]